MRLTRSAPPCPLFQPFISSESILNEITSSKRSFHPPPHHAIPSSGSMVQNLPDLKRDLTSLIWDQLHAHSIAFNLLSFSSGVRRWKPEVVDPSHKNCHDAIAWIQALRAEGGTPTLQALSMALPKEGEEESVKGIYLVTDGKPDTSMAKVGVGVLGQNVRERSSKQSEFGLESLGGQKSLQL